MGSVVGDEVMMNGGEGQGLNEADEKIFVSVRLRPLNEKEIVRNDGSDWECINQNTVIFKNSLPERSMFPAAYTFDRVFGTDCSTEQVYQEGAKQVALSVVGGINSSIFAYGQTSSGKTYTMTGVTDYAVSDIYDYIEKHKDREFVIKFSAMEIYNEAVRDLLSLDSTPLRLLDDPERGTVVERLTEETLMDRSHLQELLSICEEQRHIGETSLNETSSRSHQILRLTVESSSREFLGAEKSSTLAASVNFVDLAGSERASQILSAGARLKEGCHINRSLLTLGTVIRKLSKGRNAHVPYRDSKLTRILQNCLGGNARTAIICTMSPARSHVEQSRNTLLFASCAKEVSTSAQVNVVMSDKALVKQLQRELGRLESQLKGVTSTSTARDSAALLREKELQIEKMSEDIKELTRQRDLAQSRIEDLLQSYGEDRVSRIDENSSESSDVLDPIRSDVVFKIGNMTKSLDTSPGLESKKQCLQLSEDPEENFLLDGSTPNFVGPDPCQGWEEASQRNEEESEDICKEVRCIEMEESRGARKTETDEVLPGHEDTEGKVFKKVAMNEDETSATLKGDREPSHMNADYIYDALKQNFTMALNEDAIQSPPEGDKEFIHNNEDYTYDALKKKVQILQKTISCLVRVSPVERSPDSHEADKFINSLKFSRSRSSRASIAGIPSPWFNKTQQIEKTPFECKMGFPIKPDGSQRKVSESKYGAKHRKLSTKELPIRVRSVSMDNFSESDVDDTASVCDFVAKANNSETVLKKKSSKNLEEADLDTVHGAESPLCNWPSEFEMKRRNIIELWAACYVPLVHRTYFFLVFKGDSSDSLYMEVELRRLSFLKDSFPSGIDSMKTSQNLTAASSKRSLMREREMLSKQIQRKYPRREREAIFWQWGIKLETKQRSLQLANRVWTDTQDMNHVKESAVLVAKLINFEQPEQTPKEIIGLSFSPQRMSRRSYSWKSNMSNLM